jgi:hypothetical protein
MLLVLIVCRWNIGYPNFMPLHFQSHLGTAVSSLKVDPYWVTFCSDEYEKKYTSKVQELRL